MGMMDVMMNPMAMDLTTSSGFALQAECAVSAGLMRFGYLTLCNCRLAVNLVRRLRPKSCAILALCCNSFSIMCHTQLFEHCERQRLGFPKHCNLGQEAHQEEMLSTRMEVSTTHLWAQETF